MKIDWNKRREEIKIDFYAMVYNDKYFDKIISQEQSMLQELEAEKNKELEIERQSSKVIIETLAIKIARKDEKIKQLEADKAELLEAFKEYYFLDTDRPDRYKELIQKMEE